MVDTAYCSGCEMPYAIRSDGKIRLHTTMAGQICPGSRREPMPVKVPTNAWSYRA